MGWKPQREGCQRGFPFHKGSQILLYCTKLPFIAFYPTAVPVCVLSIPQPRSEIMKLKREVLGCMLPLFHYCLTCHLTCLLRYSVGLGRGEGLV